MAKEFIEREAAISARPEYLNPNKGEYNKGWNDCNNIVYKNIKAIPTADVQEVRHGKWVYVDGDLGWADCKCSECGYTDLFEDCTECFYNFCPECGAKMDEE